MSKQKKRSKRHRKARKMTISRKIRRAMTLEQVQANMVYEQVARDLYEIALRKGA